MLKTVIYGYTIIIFSGLVLVGKAAHHGFRKLKKDIS